MQKSLLLTPDEIAYYEAREATEIATQATLAWLASLNETRLTQELLPYTATERAYWLDELEAHLRARETA